MIMKDEITMYICSYALFLKEMLMFKYPYERKYSFSNEQFWVTFFHDKIFSLTIPWLLTTSLTFPWHVSNSLTFPGFQTSGHPEERDWNGVITRQVLTLPLHYYSNCIFVSTAMQHLPQLNSNRYFGLYNYILVFVPIFQSCCRLG